MNTAKVAVLLGVTLLGLMGAAHYYMKSQETHPVYNLRGYDDFDLRVTMFKDWMQQNNKKYSVDETHYRFALWNKRYDFVQEHNAKNLSWTVEINKFADLTREEFSALYLGYNYDPNRVRENVVYLENEEESPGSVDWRTKGAVTDLKDQGQCGACWSFSASGALEGLYKIKKGTLISLSEQQQMDCSSSYGNQGCNGGLMDNSFKYTAKSGIMKESDYTYKGKVGTCAVNASKIVFKNTAYADVTQNSYMQLKKALTNQPVSVAIEADESAFQSYKSGVISSGCGTNLDHGVLAVGYSGSSYWIVKNSWGASWGDKGYVKIAMGSQESGAGVCGINSDPSYPTL